MRRSLNLELRDSDEAQSAQVHDCSTAFFHGLDCHRCFSGWQVYDSNASWDESLEVTCVINSELGACPAHLHLDE